MQTTAMISGALRAWGSVVLDFEGALLSEAPETFRNYRLDLRFEHDESGQAIVVPGYFAADGASGESGATEGRIWRSKFRPSREGVWRWRARFRMGGDIALQDAAAVDFAGASAGDFDGASGAVRVARPQMTPPDLRARGAVQLQASELSFPESGHIAPVRAWPAFSLLHGSEFEVAPSRDVEFDAPPAGGEPSSGGRGATGAVRWALEQGANLLRVSPVLRRRSGAVSGPWRSDGRSASEERGVFDVSKIEKWASLLERAEQLGGATALLIGARDQRGAPVSLASLGLDRRDRRLFIREMTARLGFLNGLIWEADAGLIEEDAPYLSAIDPFRALVSSDALNQFAPDTLGGWPEQPTGDLGRPVAQPQTSRPAADRFEPGPFGNLEESHAQDVPARPARRAPRAQRSEAPAVEAPPVAAPPVEADSQSPNFEWSFASIDEVDRFLSGRRAIYISSLSARALEAVLRAAEFDPERQRTQQTAREPEREKPTERPVAQKPREDKRPTAEAEAARPSRQYETEERQEAEKPAEQPVEPTKAPPSTKKTHEKEASGGGSEGGDDGGDQPALRDYVGETGPLDEMDEMIAELRRSQRAAKAVPKPKSAKKAGVRRTKPAAVTATRSLGDGPSSKDASGRPADSEAPKAPILTEPEPSPRPERKAVPSDPQKEVGPEALGPGRSVAGIGDADLAALAGDSSGAAESDAFEKVPEPELPAEDPPAPPSRGVARRDEGRRFPSRPDAASSEAPGRASRVVVTAEPDMPRRRTLPSEEGVAAINLSLYVMDATSEAGSADAISLGAPMDIETLRRDGASLIARFEGADASSARFARLRVSGGSVSVEHSEPIDPLALFGHLHEFADAVERAFQSLGPGDAAPCLEIAIAPQPLSHVRPLKVWRISFASTQLQEAPSSPAEPTREELAAQARQAQAHLVRIELIDPESDQMVASFGPRGSDAPVEAAGRQLNLKAVIGGRAVGAQRARLFLPATARCARSEDRPTMSGAQATCHFYGCVFSPGRLEIELTAAESAEALERFIDSPDQNTPGILLRARVRMTLK